MKNQEAFTVGYEVELVQPFSVVRETLQRLGIVNTQKQELYPSCYILHKRGRYFIAHFKNLLLLDGRTVENFSEKDKNREASIALLLEQWNLIKIVNKDPEMVNKQIYVYVLPHEKLGDYKIVHKYKIGTNKN